MLLIAASLETHHSWGLGCFLFNKVNHFSSTICSSSDFLPSNPSICHWHLSNILVSSSLCPRISRQSSYVFFLDLNQSNGQVNYFYSIDYMLGVFCFFFIHTINLLSLLLTLFYGKSWDPLCFLLCLFSWTVLASKGGWGVTFSLSTMTWKDVVPKWGLASSSM